MFLAKKKKREEPPPAFVFIVCSKKIPQSGIHDRCMANIKPMQQVKCALGGMERGYQKIWGGGGLKKKLLFCFLATFPKS